MQVLGWIQAELRQFRAILRLALQSLPFEIIYHQKLSAAAGTAPGSSSPAPVNNSTTIVSPIENSFVPPASPTFHENSLKAVSIDAEYEMIVEALKQSNFNKTKAAKLLNIDRKTLYNKMKQYQQFNNLHIISRRR